jgi:two-component system, cell cycle sensor histidine kinase and response regulator CckA
MSEARPDPLARIPVRALFSSLAAAALPPAAVLVVPHLAATPLLWLPLLLPPFLLAFHGRWRGVLLALALGAASFFGVQLALAGQSDAVAGPAPALVPLFLAVLAGAGWVADGLHRQRLEEQQRSDRLERLEEQQRVAQRMEAVGRLAGGLAHDFNNVLTIIQGHAHLLLQAIPEDDPRRADLDDVCRAGEHGGSLIRQLLAFSRQQVLQPRVLDLNAVVLSTEGMLRRILGEDVHLTLDLDEVAGAVRADPAQIQQVLVNLATNARDAMPDGGQLEIRTGAARIDEAFAGRFPYAVRTGDYQVIAVSDTGSGMRDEVSAHIFEPFFTTSTVGQRIGLGLSTVYGIIKQSGGYIWVWSEPGAGTTFDIYLPAVHELPVADPLPAAVLPRQRREGHETILVVEDDPRVRSLVRKILVMRGYRVLEADNGRRALDLAASHLGSVDLLLTDLVMPDMGGIDLILHLTHARPGLRCVVTSGYTEDAVLSTQVLPPAAVFLPKPFTPDELAGAVRRVLDGAPT